MARGTANPELTDKVSKKANQPVHMKHYQNEQYAITRMSALKAAVQFVNPLVGKITHDSPNPGEKIPANVAFYQQLTIETADLFVQWLTGDETTASQD